MRIWSRSKPALGWLSAAAAACLLAQSAAAGGLDLRLNEIQVLGTHNSYHVQPVPELIDIFLAFDPDAILLEYTHRPLEEQFELLGIRQIELDVWFDPDGGLFAEPLGLEALTGMVVHLPEFDPPGLKVQHIADIDFVSTCTLLVDCLGILKTWSDANPRHVPIMVLIEAKDDPPPNIPAIPFVFPLPFGPEAFDDLDAEILSVFPPEQILTPDDVRGARASLDEAIRKDGWPTLRELRGKVLFALDNGGQYLADYVDGHPALAGRVLFTDSPPGSPEAAFVKLNEPVAEREADHEAGAQGLRGAHARRRGHDPGAHRQHGPARHRPAQRRPVGEHRLSRARSLRHGLHRRASRRRARALQSRERPEKVSRRRHRAHERAASPRGPAPLGARPGGRPEPPPDRGAHQGRPRRYPASRECGRPLRGRRQLHAREPRHRGVRALRDPAGRRLGGPRRPRRLRGLGVPRSRRHERALHAARDSRGQRSARRSAAAPASPSVSTSRARASSSSRSSSAAPTTTAWSSAARSCATSR